MSWNFPLNPLVYLFHFTDTSSVDQRPSSPEREEDSDTQETEQAHVIDMISTVSLSAGIADDLVGLEVNTEILSDHSIPEVRDTGSEPSSSAKTKEEETSEAAAPDS